jgi:pimeloyl-ACP methyl ester carboxylesterase
MRLMNGLIALMLGMLLAAQATASDYAREKKWADEILPSVLVGDAVWLDGAKDHKFLALYTAVPNAKGAVILGHGIGVHPDWGLIGMLRQSLAEKGYTTLSIQFPVLAADAKAEAYPPTFDEAAARLAKATDYLKQKGYGRIAIVSHSLGCRMSYRYLSGKPDAAVKTWVALSSPGTEDWGKLKLPVLDLYGQNDLPAVLQNAKSRASGLKQPGSTQQQLPKADHFFEGQDAALLKAVADYLGKHL